MALAALVLWILTAVGGATMAAIWIAGRGPEHHRHGRSRFSVRRLGSHAGLALVGLALWAAFLATESAATGIAALLLLPAVAGLGVLLLLTWLAGRGGRPASSGADTAPEQRIPPPLVAGHGALAVATLVAVVVALAS